MPYEINQTINAHVFTLLFEDLYVSYPLSAHKSSRSWTASMNQWFDASTQNKTDDGVDFIMIIGLNDTLVPMKVTYTK